MKDLIREADEIGEALEEDLKRYVGECAACKEKRYHTEEEWANHPNRGHGFSKEQGWTRPDLEPKK